MSLLTLFQQDLQSGGSSGPTVLQRVSNKSDDTATTLSIGSGQGLSATGAGNTLVFTAWADGQSTAPTISDSASNTWTLAEGFSPSSGNYLGVWVCSGAASITTVTMTVGTASQIAAQFYEIEGVVTTSSVDQVKDADADSTAPTVTTSTTTQASEIAIGVIGTSNAGVSISSQSSGWTVDAKVVNTYEGAAIWPGTLVLTSEQTVTYAGTLSGSSYWGAIVVTLFATTGPPPSGVTFGTPANNGGTSASSYTLTLSDVEAGQPIVLGHTGANTDSNITSIAGTLGSSYTWTRIKQYQAEGQDAEIWVGTWPAGSGGSGTIVVTIDATNIAGGVAVPCIGASTASGSSIVDASSVNSGTGTTLSASALSASGSGDGAVLVAFGGGGGGPLTVFPSSPWTNNEMEVSGSPYGDTATQGQLSSGSLTTPTWTQTSSDYWCVLGVLILPQTGNFTASISESLTVVDALARKFVGTRNPTTTLSVSDAAGRVYVGKRGLSETVSVTDTLARRLTAVRSTSVTLSVSDQLGRLGLYKRVMSETTSVADSLSRLVRFLRGETESLSTTDVLARKYTGSRSVSNTLQVSDTIVRTAKLSRSVSESMSSTDVLHRLGLFVRVVSNTLSVTDSISTSTIQAFFAYITESLTTSDSIARKYIGRRGTAETLSVADVLSRLGRFVRTANVTLSVTDALSRQGVFARAVSLSIPVTDALSRSAKLARSLSESLTLTVSLARLASLRRSESESLTVTDSIVRIGAFKRVISLVLPTLSDAISTGNAFFSYITESVLTSDTLKRTYHGLRSMSESKTIVDALSRMASHHASMTEALTVEDTLARRALMSRAVTVTLSVSDTLSRLGRFLRGPNVSLTVTDTIARSGRFARSLAESTSLADSVYRSFGAFVTLSESLPAIQASIVRRYAGRRGPSESVTVLDYLGRGFRASRGLVEALASILDQASRLAGLRRGMSESSLTSDALSRLASFAASITESVGLADVLSSGPNVFGRSLAESMSVVDTVEGFYHRFVQAGRKVVAWFRSFLLSTSGRITVIAAQNRTMTLVGYYTPQGGNIVQCVPNTVQQLTTEMIPWEFDFSNLMAETGDSVSNPYAKLMNVSSGSASSPVIEPQVSGNSVVQTIIGPSAYPAQDDTDPLVAQDSFQLVVTAQLNSGKIVAMILNINVPS